MPSKKKLPVDDPNGSAVLSWQFMKFEDCRHEDLACALCGTEMAQLRLIFNSKPMGKKMVLSLGKHCLDGTEAGIRSFRKWSIRGGKL